MKNNSKNVIDKTNLKNDHRMKKLIFRIYYIQ